MLRFFARTVEHRAQGLREMRCRLQEEGRLANPGLTADQHQRSRDNAAAEHAIELFYPARQPLGHNSVDFFVQPRSGCGRQWYRAPALAAAAPAPAVAGTGRSSTSEFHAPQSVHRPSHLGDCDPHSWQT